jgi:hypothetical protein
MADLIRVKFPILGDLDHDRVRRWDRHATRLLKGLIPKSWKVSLLPTPGSPDFALLMRLWCQNWRAAWGPPPLGIPSWYVCAMGPFRDYCPRIQICLRHGFICGVAWDDESTFLKTAPALFRSQPIEWAIICGKFPSDSGLRKVWYRGQENLDDVHDILHPDLFDLLQDGVGGCEQPSYSGQATALEALGQACVEWGRKSAIAA